MLSCCLVNVEVPKCTNKLYQIFLEKLWLFPCAETVTNVNAESKKRIHHDHHDKKSMLTNQPPPAVSKSQ